MRLSPLYLTFLFDLCLLGLARSLETFCFGIFLEILFQRGENVGPKQASVSKVEEASYV
jgi:hypothetical protein